MVNIFVSHSDTEVDWGMAGSSIGVKNWFDYSWNNFKMIEADPLLGRQ